MTQKVTGKSYSTKLQEKVTAKNAVKKMQSNSQSSSLKSVHIFMRKLSS
jgi:hypothetical protein